MSDPLHHVRRADVPWRSDESAQTECGRPAAEFAPGIVLDRVEAITKWKEYGARRSALLFCMNCVDTTNRWPNWDDDPAAVMERYVTRWSRRNPRETLIHELRAIAALVAAHRDEFDAYIEGLASTNDLAARRAAKTYQRRSRPG